MVLKRKTLNRAAATGTDSGLTVCAGSGKWTEPKKAERRGRSPQPHSDQRMLENG